MKDISRLTLTPDQRRAAIVSDWEIIRPGLKKRSVSLGDTIFIEKRFFCQDCEVEHDLIDFVVWDHLWRKVMGSKDDSNKAEGIICIHCFEKRLGRKICLDDLVPNAGMNEKFFFGAKMMHTPINHKPLNAQKSFEFLYQQTDVIKSSIIRTGRREPFNVQKLFKFFDDIAEGIKPSIIRTGRRESLSEDQEV